MFGEWKEWKGYAYAGGMFITAVIQSLALHQYFHKMTTIGMRMRTGIIGLVYEKVINKNINTDYQLEQFSIVCQHRSHAAMAHLIVSALLDLKVPIPQKMPQRPFFVSIYYEL